MRELLCQVAVIGAGPAGLAAASAAHERGADVLLIDEQAQAGGQIWRRRATQPPGRVLADWQRRCAGLRWELGSAVIDGCGPGTRAQTGGRPQAATAGGKGSEAQYFELLLWSAQRGTTRLRAQSVVLATGAQELFLPFPGWTLPGVVGVGALQALLHAGLELRGQRVLLAGSGPLLLAVAVALRRAGAKLLGILEQAPRRAVWRFGLKLGLHPAKLLAGAGLVARLSGVPVFRSAWVRAAEGPDRVKWVQAEIDGRQRAFEVDWLATGFGLEPNTVLGRHLGAACRAGALAVDGRGQCDQAGLFAAGETTGIGGAAAALAQGQLAGWAAACHVLGSRPEDAQRLRRLAGPVARERRFAADLEQAFRLRSELLHLAQAETLVCRCEDVTLGALSGCHSAREAKLRTRCGMGACQGRLCAPLLERVFGWTRESPRPPLSPVPLAALAAYPSASAHPSD
jgi:NADPH-dependent 2,4-dienoyl-CoA reductase/sulfur reductase-like enzyme